MKKIDIDLRQKPTPQTKAKREIFFGGERLRKVEIWQNSLGEANTVRIYYSDGEKE